MKKEAGVAGGMEAELLGRISELIEELYNQCSVLTKR